MLQHHQEHLLGDKQLNKSSSLLLNLESQLHWAQMYKYRGNLTLVSSDEGVACTSGPGSQDCFCLALGVRR